MSIPENHFPVHGQSTPQDVLDWKPIVLFRPLAMRVLAVARTRIEGAWSAYVDAVPGVRHRLEIEAVLLEGEKLAEEVARVIFPEFEDVPYAS